MKQRNTLHIDPEQITPSPSADAVRLDFARRLQQAMARKGYNQAELARESSKYTASGRPIGRDSISIYINGRYLPSAERLAAIAQALGVEKTDLMPPRAYAAPKDPPLDIKDLSDGRVWLRVNQAVEWSKALKILEIIKSDEIKSENDADK